ncbi:MAG: YdcH family protein [Gemmatimonas sp.]
MAVPELVKKLTNEHRALEAAIAQERCRPQPDEKRIKDLKREKLRIKDRLTTLGADATH